MFTYRKMISMLALFITVFSLVIAPVSAAGIQQVDKQSSTSACPSFDPAQSHDAGFLQSLRPECKKAYRNLIQKSGIESNKSNISPMAVGGPDTFGYTFNDAVSYSWISATTDSGLIGDEDYLGPINIGFNFPFYGLTQSQLYFSTNGLISFGAGYYGYGGDSIPGTQTPNNFIAPYTMLEPSTICKAA
jgi:hypothetical protein